MEETGSPSPTAAAHGRTSVTAGAQETDFAASSAAAPGSGSSSAEQAAAEQAAQSAATLADYNPSTSKGHEILSQVYQQSQV